MNLTPEDAEKILAADLRNIVKKVSEGGVLSSTERAMLQNCAVPGGKAKGRRAAVLLAKYASGARLTAAELSEIREVHPTFEMDASPQDDPITRPPLALTPEPSPAAGDSEITRVQLDRWGEMYGTQHRQLRRWIARGREHNDPCPLDDPEQMPIWWERNMEKPKRAPDKVLAAADAIRAEKIQSASVDPLPAATAETTATSPPASTQRIASINLEDFSGEEAEAARVFRRNFAAITSQLENAYRNGVEADIAKLTTRLERTGESLRKHEIAAEQRAKRQGELLSRSEVYHEVSTAIGALQIMREHMASRIVAAMPDLTPEQAVRLRVEIETIRAREDDVLRNINSIKNPDDVQLQLVS